MKRRHGFIPVALDQLESRVVLSRTTQGLATVVSGLSPRLRVLNREQQAMSAEIQQAFTSFDNDYDQARRNLFCLNLKPAQPKPRHDQRVHAVHNGSASHYSPSS